jgi:hypothetical protein
MLRSKLPTKALLLATVAAFAGSQPAAAQSYSDYSCPVSSVYNPAYGCSVTGADDYGYYGGLFPMATGCTLAGVGTTASTTVSPIASVVALTVAPRLQLISQIAASTPAWLAVIPSQAASAIWPPVSVMAAGGTARRIFSSAENCRRVERRIALITCSVGSFAGPDFCPICAPSKATHGSFSPGGGRSLILARAFRRVHSAALAARRSDAALTGVSAFNRHSPDPRRIRDQGRSFERLEQSATALVA